MAIPSKPLVLNFDFGEMTLGELDLLDTRQKSETIIALNVRDFLKKYSSSWTIQEIEGIQLKELAALFPQIVAAVKATTPVPKGKSRRSKTGRGSSPVKSPDG